MYTEQLNNTVYFYFTFNTASTPKTGVSGLSDLTIDIYRGSTSLISGASGLVEIGNGIYRYVYSSTSTAEIYSATAHTADSSVEYQDVNAFAFVGQNWIEQIDDIKAKTDLINQGANVEIVSPIADNQSIYLVRGDDYLFVDDRHLAFTLENGHTIGVDDIINFIVKKADLTVFTKTCVRTDDDAFYLELTSAETLEIGSGSKKYDIELVLDSDSAIITLIQGNITVNPDVR